MIPEREREALMRLTMCAREECGMCKYKETCDFGFQYETATRCMNILADALNADCKTENCSEKPNNCEVKNYCDDCLYTDTCDSKEFFYACTSKATISKMEQVDEPQTDIHGITDCDFCKHESEEWDSEACDGCCNANNHFEPKDEPQTERSSE